MYDLYKPLRNRLRTLSLLPSLYGVYRLIQFAQFGAALPPELRYPGFGWQPRLRVGLHEWTLELLARELILNAPAAGPRAMTTWNEFAGLANIVHDIENRTWGRPSDRPYLIEYEMVRIAHRQFPWQVSANGRLITSYFKLYSNRRLAGLMQQTFGMTAVAYYQLALAICGHFLERPVLGLPVVNDVNAVERADVDRLVARMSLPVAGLRARIADAQVYNLNWPYLFDPLRTWPMMDIGASRLFCPMPTLLLWRITEGVYFDLVQHRVPFDQNFGLAFQDLVGEVVKAADTEARLQLFPEERYGTRQRPRDSVDWIIQDETATIFLECKASRLKAHAKVDLNDIATIDGEVDRLARFVVQVYATMADAVGGAYRQWRPNGLPIYPLVVTLDEWLPSGRPLIHRLEIKVREGLQARGLPPGLLDDHPFTLCSLHEFEAAARAFSSASVQAVMGAKTAAEENGWAMFPFLQSRFPRALTEGRMLFEAEWRTISQNLHAVL